MQCFVCALGPLISWNSNDRPSFERCGPLTVKQLSTMVLPALLILAALTYVTSLSPSVGHSIDDGIHIVAAKALATGHGLRMISDPGDPPATQFPPGQSLFLTPVLWFFPDAPANTIPLQLVSTFFGLCFVGLSWLWFRRHFDFSTTLFLTALVAFNPETVRFSSAVIAEMGYAAFSLTTILLFERTFPNESSPPLRWGIVLATVVAMTCAYLFRSVGLGLIVAIPCALVLRRRWGAAAIVVGAFLILAAPWLFKSALVGTPEYRDQFWLANLESPELGKIGLVGLTDRIGQNAINYLFVTIPNHLFSFLGSQRVIRYLDSTGLNPVLVLARIGVSTLLFIGLWRRIRSGVRMVDLYLGVYGAMLLVWHARLQWKYMAPITPILLYYFYHGLTWTIARTSWHSATVKRVGYAILAIALVGYGFRIRDSIENGWLASDAEDPFAPAYGWIKQETPKNSLIISFDHLGLFLYTGRKSVAPLMSHNAQSVLDYTLKTGADYFVVHPTRVFNEVPTLDDQYQQPALTLFPERFSHVYADSIHHITVYRINRNL